MGATSQKGTLDSGLVQSNTHSTPWGRRFLPPLRIVASDSQRERDTACLGRGRLQSPLLLPLPPLPTHSPPPQCAQLSGGGVMTHLPPHVLMISPVKKKWAIWAWACGVRRGHSCAS
jgi:hypothetical protein